MCRPRCRICTVPNSPIGASSPTSVSRREGLRPTYTTTVTNDPVCRHVRRVGPDRLGRVLLELSPDLYYAVSTGIWDATVNPSVDDKKSPTSAQEPEPQRALVFHQRHKIHRQVGPVLQAHA